MATNINKNKSSVLSQWLNHKKNLSTNFTIPLIPKEEIPRPSSGQHRLWLLQKLYPENPFYQYAHLYKIKGALDIPLLKDSFQFLIDKHAILRTNFLETEDGLSLKINPPEKFSLEFTDLSGCLLYTSPSPRDATLSRMPSSA